MIRSFSQHDPRTGTTVIELVTVIALLTVTVSVATALLLTWQTHRHQRNVRWRRVVERERLAAALLEDAVIAREIAVKKDQLTILRPAGSTTERVEYRIGRGRVDRVERSAAGTVVGRETFLYGHPEAVKWNVTRRGSRYIVRIGPDRFVGKMPPDRLVSELGIAVSGRLLR